MARRTGELVIEAADAERLAAFWSEVLGYVETGRESDGSIETGPSGTGFGCPQPTIVLSPGSEPRTGQLRHRAFDGRIQLVEYKPRVLEHPPLGVPG